MTSKATHQLPVLFSRFPPAIPLLSVYPKELKAGSPRCVSTLMFIVTLLQIAKMWKQLKFSLMDDGTEMVVYIQNGILCRL